MNSSTLLLRKSSLIPSPFIVLPARDAPSPTKKLHRPAFPPLATVGKPLLQLSLGESHGRSRRTRHCLAAGLARRHVSDRVSSHRSYFGWCTGKFVAVREALRPLPFGDAECPPLLIPSASRSEGKLSTYSWMDDPGGLPARSRVCHQRVEATFRIGTSPSA